MKLIYNSSFCDKLKQFTQSSKGLTIISDFDQTLTKANANGTDGDDTFDVFTRSQQVDNECKEAIEDSADNYENVVPSLSPQSKKKQLDKNITSSLNAIACQQLTKKDLYIQL